jgi:hypothetical protein
MAAGWVGGWWSYGLVLLGRKSECFRWEVFEEDPEQQLEAFDQ